MTLDLSLIRSQFPALAGDAVFLDNPAGTQVAAQVLKRINQYLVEMNANAHGAFSTSIASDILLDETRAACADFYNASRPEEIVFGPNMTSLTFNFSRSLARQLGMRSWLPAWIMMPISHPGRWWLKIGAVRSAG